MQTEHDIWSTWVEAGGAIAAIEARSASADILAHIAAMTPLERVTTMTRNRDFPAICGAAVVVRDGTAEGIFHTFRLMRLGERQAFVAFLRQARATRDD